jgi:hypothetical protein
MSHRSAMWHQSRPEPATMSHRSAMWQRVRPQRRQSFCSPELWPRLGLESATTRANEGRSPPLWPEVPSRGPERGHNVANRSVRPSCGRDWGSNRPQRARTRVVHRRCGRKCPRADRSAATTSPIILFARVVAGSAISRTGAQPPGSRLSVPRSRPPAPTSSRTPGRAPPSAPARGPSPSRRAEDR